MVSIYDVDANELIKETAKKLEKMPELAPPSWAAYVKTGVHKERPPIRNDWWFIRSAAILRSIYKLGPIGVSKLRRKYGGRKNRGMAPNKTFKGSGSIIRKILQKLEIVGFVEQAQKGVHKGRIITPKGRSFLDNISSKIYIPIEKTKKKKPKEETKEKTELKKKVKKEKPKKEKKPVKREPKEKTKAKQRKPKEKKSGKKKVKKEKPKKKTKQKSKKKSKERDKNK
jgi:small subunit ribosomal protein S19e